SMFLQWTSSPTHMKWTAVRSGLRSCWPPWFYIKVLTRVVLCSFLPNYVSHKDTYQQKAFCGVYSENGNMFLSACQDQNIRLYDTTRGRFHLRRTVKARDVGWSVLDVCFTPDTQHVLYSSWSDYIHLCSVDGDSENHTALDLNPDERRFSVFSLAASTDGKEILGGANDGCLYVFDLEQNKRTLKIDAHEDDVNAVAFADSSSQLLFSGSDDALCKVWDRRTLREDRPQPVGQLAGHRDGITFIHSKGDARYLISNSKDQSIKLWDVRKFSPKEGLAASRLAVTQQNWDYRWQQVPQRALKKHKLTGDTSVMTYRGHGVLHTLIRCRFSPEFSTGQRFIYSGCSTGKIIIYDVLTGRVVSRLTGHDACVRDVSWHPYEDNIISSSVRSRRSDIKIQSEALDWPPLNCRVASRRPRPPFDSDAAKRPDSYLSISRWQKSTQGKTIIAEF
uniref:Uncharacterized protein n=1 Tax=Salarias fasciatus TaxID=181472 RepID=A0A672GJF4_SALFA